MVTVYRIEHPETGYGPHASAICYKTWKCAADHAGYEYWDPSTGEITRYLDFTHPISHPSPHEDDLPTPQPGEIFGCATPKALRHWWRGLLLALDHDGYEYLTVELEPGYKPRTGHSGQCMWWRDKGTVVRRARCRTLAEEAGIEA